MPNIVKGTLVKDDNGDYVYPITTADSVLMEANGSTTVKDELARLWAEMDGMTYEAMKVSSFSISPTYVEYGDIIKELRLNFSFNRTPATITVSIGGNTYDIPNTSTTYTISNLNIRNNTSVTITAIDPKNSRASASSSIQLRRRYFYGASERFTGISVLSHSISASRSMSLTLTATGNNHLYFVCPISNINDRTTFNVGGFEGGFNLIGLIHVNTLTDVNLVVNSNNTLLPIDAGNVINTSTADPYTTVQTYAVYESENTNLGTTSVRIS